MIFLWILSSLLLTYSTVNVVAAGDDVCKATAWGDPHIVTWDSLRFDAQPEGEVLFLQSSTSSLEIQGRLEKIGPGFRGNPAVTTGVAAKGKDGNPVIQVSIAPSGTGLVSGFGEKEDGYCAYGGDAAAPEEGGGDGDGSGCCSNDFKTCDAPWCGATKESCMSCSGDKLWLSNGAVSGTCQARWAACTNDVNSCCPSLKCVGSVFYRECEVGDDTPPDTSTSTWIDQDNGVIKLYGGSQKDSGNKHLKCLQACAAVEGVTGCEMIWSQSNKGCYAHTQRVDFGNGSNNHSCYVVKDSSQLSGSVGEVTNVLFNSHSCPIQLIVNGKRTTGISYEGDASVTQEGRNVVIEYSDTLKIDIKLSYYGRCYFSVDFFLYNCESHEGTVNGLLGTPNGNPQDDWTARDGTVLPLPNGVGNFFFAPAFEYTKNNWILTSEGDSLFNYNADDSFDKHSNPGEVYDPEIEALVMNPGPKIAGICKGDTQCIIDGELLGEEAAEEFMENPASAIPLQPVFLTNANEGVPGVKGDPHFKTWAGEHFEYHGKCDLELLSDPNFANGKGLDVHIRAEIIRSYSYVKNAVVRLGNDILEVEGSTKDYENHYWLNGEYLGTLKYFGGFPIKFKQLNKKSNVFTIDLQTKEKQTIVVRTYREWIRVEFMNANEAMYGHTIGILGDFVTGSKIARDGLTVMKSNDDYGQEWQVQSSPKLFRKEDGPQYPEKCIISHYAHSAHSTSLRGRRRLNEETVSEIDAEDACSNIMLGDDRKECIYDVLATGDIESAGAY